jgi:vacuole morphology and inheritance protein 14
LNFDKNQYLVRALYGLLMLLPQSDAFLTLKQRLDCVPNYCNKISQLQPEPNKNNLIKSQIDFNQLLAHFIEIQDKHRFFKKKKYIDQYRRFLNNSSQSNDTNS